MNLLFSSVDAVEGYLSEPAPFDFIHTVNNDGRDHWRGPRGVIRQCARQAPAERRMHRGSADGRHFAFTIHVTTQAAIGTL